MEPTRGFPEPVTALLERLYSEGLRGWGVIYAEKFQEAVDSTSLTESQVNVIMC